MSFPCKTFPAELCLFQFCELVLTHLLVVLATGGIIYDVINIVAFFTLPPECQSFEHLLHPITDIVFVVLEVVLLLNFAKVLVKSVNHELCVVRDVIMRIT